MRFDKIKSNHKFEVNGVKIDLQVTNDDIKGINFEFDDGQKIFVSEGKYCGIDILIPSPPEKVKKWIVIGRYHQIEDFEREFDSQFEAEKFIVNSGLDSLESKEIEREVENV